MTSRAFDKLLDEFERLHSQRWRRGDPREWSEYLVDVHSYSESERVEFLKTVLYCEGWERRRARAEDLNWSQSFAISGFEKCTSLDIKLVRSRLAYDWIVQCCKDLEGEWQSWQLQGNDRCEQPDWTRFLGNSLDYHDVEIEHLVATDFWCRDEYCDVSPEPEDYTDKYPHLKKQLEFATSPIIQSSSNRSYACNVSLVIKQLTEIRNSPIQIDEYEIQEKLGEGGHGIVFLAKTKRLRKNVALKVPLLPDPDMAYPSLRELCVIGEARKLADLHQLTGVIGVNQVHGPLIDSSMPDEDIAWLVRDYLRTDGKPPMIDMEFASKGTLKKWIEEDRPELVVFASKIKEVSKTLAEIHQKYVHRDIKPGNIFLDHDLTPKIGDLGIAKPMARFVNRAVGTLHYMAPEVLLNKHVDFANIGARDVYSLGVILYEFIAGRKPFDYVNKVKLRNAILKEDPVPFSELSTDLEHEILDSSIENICLRCLEKDPKDRPTATQLFEELESWISNQDLPPFVERVVETSEEPRKLGNSADAHESNSEQLSTWLQCAQGHKISVFWLDGDLESKDNGEIIKQAYANGLQQCVRLGNDVWSTPNVARLTNVLEESRKRPISRGRVIGLLSPYPRGDLGESKSAWTRTLELMVNPDMPMLQIFCIGTTDELLRLKREFGEKIKIHHVKYDGANSPSTGLNEWIRMGDVETQLATFLEFPGLPTLKLEDHYQPIRLKLINQNLDLFFEVNDLVNNLEDSSLREEQYEHTPEKTYKNARSLIHLPKGTKALIVGSSGSGKSTLLKDLVSKFWESRQMPSERIAFRVPLSQLEQSGMGLAEYLATRCEREIHSKHYRPTQDQLTEKLLNGDAIVLLDALDRLRDPVLLSRLFNDFPKSTFIVTYKPVVKIHQKLLRIFDSVWNIEGLSLAQSKEFIENYFKDDIAATAKFSQLVDNRILPREFFDSPLLLNIFCLAANELDNIQNRNRSEIFSTAFEKLLDMSNTNIDQFDLTSWCNFKFAAVSEIAIEQVFGNQESVPLERANSIIDRHLPENKVGWKSLLINELMHKTKILVMQSTGQIGFCHPLIASFAAANSIAKSINSSKDACENHRVFIADQELGLMEFLDIVAWHSDLQVFLQFIVVSLEEPVFLIELIRNPIGAAPFETDDLFRHRLSNAALVCAELSQVDRWVHADLVDEITSEVCSQWVSIKDVYDGDIVSHLDDAIESLARQGGKINGLSIAEFVLREIKTFGLNRLYAELLSIVVPATNDVGLFRKLYSICQGPDAEKWHLLRKLLPSISEVDDFEGAKELLCEIAAENNWQFRHSIENLLLFSANNNATSCVIEGLLELTEHSQALVRITTAKVAGMLIVSKKSKLQYLQLVLELFADKDERVRLALIEGFSPATRTNPPSILVQQQLISVIQDSDSGDALVDAAIGVLSNSRIARSIIDAVSTMLRSENSLILQRGLSLAQNLLPECGVGDIQRMLLRYLLDPKYYEDESNSKLENTMISIRSTPDLDSKVYLDVFRVATQQTNVSSSIAVTFGQIQNGSIPDSEIFNTCLMEFLQSDSDDRVRAGIVLAQKLDVVDDRILEILVSISKRGLSQEITNVFHTAKGFVSSKKFADIAERILCSEQGIELRNYIAFLAKTLHQCDAGISFSKTALRSLLLHAGSINKNVARLATCLLGLVCRMSDREQLVFVAYKLNSLCSKMNLLRFLAIVDFKDFHELPEIQDRLLRLSQSDSAVERLALLQLFGHLSEPPECFVNKYPDILSSKNPIVLQLGIRACKKLSPVRFQEKLALYVVQLVNSDDERNQLLGTFLMSHSPESFFDISVVNRLIKIATSASPRLANNVMRLLNRMPGNILTRNHSDQVKELFDANCWEKKMVAIRICYSLRSQPMFVDLFVLAVYNDLKRESSSTRLRQLFDWVIKFELVNQQYFKLIPVIVRRQTEIRKHPVLAMFITEFVAKDRLLLRMGDGQLIDRCPPQLTNVGLSYER